MGLNDRWTVGERRHSLVALRIEGRSKVGSRLLMVRCDCGSEKAISVSDFGRHKSCGCKRWCGVRRTHGHSKQGGAYRSWLAMKRRCYEPSNNEYRRYGAVGVTVCDRWRHSFENFLEDMGQRTDDESLDRYPNKTGNYEPGNCRWATETEQQRNRTNNKLVEFRGETRCVAEWADIFGISKQRAYVRLNAGWPPERAFTTPARPLNRRRVAA